MRTTYAWKRGYHAPKIDAQAAGESLDALRSKLGVLTAEGVLVAAKPKRSKLHKAFEWDDSVAAQKHRLWQAGMLIRSVCVTVVNGEPSEPVRAFVVISNGEDSYVNVVDAMADPAMRAQVLARAESEFLAWKSRYEHLEEFSELVTRLLSG